MSINVYWSSPTEFWQRLSAPELVAKEYYSKNIHDSDNMFLSTNRCPFFNKHFINLYQTRSFFEYSFKIEGNEVITNDYDQNFFDKYLFIRSIEKKCFSLRNDLIFFTDEKSLELTAYEFPYLEDNNITKRCITMPGTFDIGKWFRPLDFPFYLKNDFNEFVVEEGEIISYLRFHTKEKINFKQFYYTEKIKKYSKDCMQTGKYLNFKNQHPLNFFYNNFKLKKMILEEIKENLLD